MSEGVEWAVHCCTVLAALPADQALPAAKLAELHAVPPAYLAKHLQALGRAGVVTSLAGPLGGFRLARPPADITVLDVVLAVEGDEPAFRCTEIRQRGPLAGGPESYANVCLIARTMWEAEDAWRRHLAATTIGDLVRELLTVLPPDELARGAAWVTNVHLERRRKRS